jgi:hypothetical protein
MALEGTGRHYVSETSRTIIYVSQRLASDSAWPFEHKDPLKIKIDGDRVLVEKRKEGDRKEAGISRL